MLIVSSLEDKELFHRERESVNTKRFYCRILIGRRFKIQIGIYNTILDLYDNLEIN